MSSGIQKLLSRRNLLRNTALLTVVTPVLRRMDPAHAGGASPRRVILVFTPNGPMRRSGPATGTETDFQLDEWWAPLERHRDDAIFMSNTAPPGAGKVEGPGGHGLGGNAFTGYGTFRKAGNYYAAKGESIDQVIGRRLTEENRAGIRPTVTWGTTGRTQTAGTGDAFSTARETHIAPEISPEKAWAELFSGFTPPPSGPEATAQAEALIRRERSILDFVHEDCLALRNDLGAEGTRLLDAHCTTVRTMEQAVGAQPSGVGCDKPMQAAAKDWSDAENTDEQMTHFIDLIGATLACELSHVIGFQFGGQAARNRLPMSYDVPSSRRVDSGDSGPAHHPWTHQRPSDEGTRALSIFSKFYAEQVAALVDKLKTTTDASGAPLLDSTVVYWASELGGTQNGHNSHLLTSIPAVLFGNGQGTFKTGRYVRGKTEDGTGKGGFADAGREAAQALVSLLHYMGLEDVNTVGETGVNGPLEILKG